RPERTRRPRPHRGCNRVRRADVHHRRAKGRLRGGLGGAARRRELSKERRRGGRLGDPNRPPSSARSTGREASGALSGRTHVEVRQSRPALAAEREEKGRLVRAVVYDRYGPPDVLRLEEVERPVPKDDEVRVKLHATAATRRSR